MRKPSKAMKSCPKCTAPMDGPTCDLCERFERVRRARIARWRFYATQKPLRLTAPANRGSK